MGWEERNGNRYYYLKQRHGDHVYSIYVGKGEWVNLMLAHKKKEKKRRLHNLKEMERRKQEIELQFQKTSIAFSKIANLTSAILLTSGYHTHKGQWRKYRE